MRKTDAADSNYFYDVDIAPFANSTYVGFIIHWSSPQGFGEYTIFKFPNSDQWLADSETMDTENDKSFLSTLIQDFIRSIKVVD